MTLRFTLRGWASCHSAQPTALSAEEILRTYAKRWSIEPLFHNLKRWWGVSNLWQQSRRVLELWMQIRATSMDTDTTAQPDGATGILPTRPSCTLAYQSTVHCRSGGAMDADRQTGTNYQGRFRPKVAEILVPKRAKRSKNARVAPPAPVADTLLNYISHPDCSVYEMRGGSANV